MAVTYVTVEELRAATTEPAFTEVDEADEYVITDEQMTAKIETAEIYIDSIAKYWDKYDLYQTRTFPRSHDIDEDGATFIPATVKEATIAQVEFAFINMPDRDHGVMPDEKPTMESISPRAMQLMSNGYIKRTGRITLPSQLDYRKGI